MAKEIDRVIKLQIPAGAATPAPPVGTALGPAGISPGDFCPKFNDATKDRKGDVLPVEITVYKDKSFDFVVKEPPAAFLIKKVAKIQKGSSKGANEVVATITKEDLRKLAETKMPDLNANTIEAAMNILEGTARNMGVAVKGVNDKELEKQHEEALAQEREAAKREKEFEEMQESAKDTSMDIEVIGEKAEENETEETKEEN